MSGFDPKWRYDKHANEGAAEDRRPPDHPGAADAGPAVRWNLSALASRVGPFDVIIDDGSHVNAHVRASFQSLFVDHLNPGGFYSVHVYDKIAFVEKS